MTIFGMEVVVNDQIPSDMIAFCQPLNSPVEAESAIDRIVIDQIGNRFVGVELVGLIINVR